MLSSIAKRNLPRASARAFSTSRVALSEGAINNANDAFSEKERAQENVYIKKHEAEQLKALREKLEKQKQTIEKLEKEIDDIKK
ncbi:ATPase inhibitor mitochondrial precursor [Scheffersomyces xylosifermentans]|uniref:ATPase inhibitor mitochondrial precursor n=1 Tax=Scheffersomyces xylosifermentans TaxID=1304137 RepID=UPI00315D2849